MDCCRRRDTEKVLKQNPPRRKYRVCLLLCFLPFLLALVLAAPLFRAFTPAVPTPQAPAVTPMSPLNALCHAPPSHKLTFAASPLVKGFSPAAVVLPPSPLVAHTGFSSMYINHTLAAPSCFFCSPPVQGLHPCSPRPRGTCSDPHVLLGALSA
jgi:hypothetical protein